MNIPNLLTLSRIFLTPLIVLFLFLNIPYNYFIAAFLFLIGCFTDLLDGYIARKFNQGSKLGIFLDPMADKVFSYSIVLILLYFNVFPLWVTILIFVRDMAVDAFLNFSLAYKVFIKASYPGKYKSFFLNLAIIIGIFALSLKNGEWFFGFNYPNLYNVAYFILIISFLLGFLGVNTLMQEYHKKVSKEY
jgi:CDP-diacylglycerol--glycerol-3-phosphate 3-phosphatidyltransferase